MPQICNLGKWELLFRKTCLNCIFEYYSNEGVQKNHAQDVNKHTTILDNLKTPSPIFVYYCSNSSFLKKHRKFL